MLFGVVTNLKDRKEDSEDLAEGLKYFIEKILDKNNIRKSGSSTLAEYVLDK